MVLLVNLVFFVGFLCCVVVGSDEFRPFWNSRMKGVKVPQISGNFLKWLSYLLIGMLKPDAIWLNGIQLLSAIRAGFTLSAQVFLSKLFMENTLIYYHLIFVSQFWPFFCNPIIWLSYISLILYWINNQLSAPSINFGYPSLIIIAPGKTFPDSFLSFIKTLINQTTA